MAGTEQRKLAAIMFTDMVGYSVLAQRDEALALELLEEHRRVVRGLLPRHGGREVKTTGDGFLLEFPSALAAVQGAVEIQHALHERNQVSPAERQVRLRIGIHVGDVVMNEGDIHGDGVNIAARIEPLAAPGGICISSAVHEQVRNKLSQPMAALGPAELKNIELPVVVHRVVMPWEVQSSSRREVAQTSGRKPNQSLVTSAATKWSAIVALVLLAVGLGWWFVHQSSRATKQVASSPAASSAAPTADQKSIAVLPFVNLSADKADEYLSDGMTEELLNVLAQVPGLRVPGRSSSFAFKGKTEDNIFRKVGEQLHVATVLEGSVRKAGDKLRITAQLINVTDGFHLWSQTYDREMKDILAVQTEVALQVVQALQVKLGVEATRALGKTQNPEAHRLYLLGRHHFGKATQAGWADAIQAFNQAIQLDPSYALAYCGLADNYNFLGGVLMPGKEAWAKEMVAARKAVDLDPNLADAHLSLAMALAGDFDWPGIEHEIKRALELNPNLALARDQYAWVHTLHGRFDEAATQSKMAVELDPLSPLMHLNRGYWFYLARRFDEANTHIRKALELDPNSPWAFRCLGWSLLWKGDKAGALLLMDKAQSLDADPFSIGSFGYALAVSGDRAKAGQILRDLENLEKQRYVSPAASMVVHIGLGEKEKALERLEKCYEDRDPACWTLKVEPFYDSLRAEPRFQALLKKVGLDK